MYKYGYKGRIDCVNRTKFRSVGPEEFCRKIIDIQYSTLMDEPV